MTLFTVFYDISSLKFFSIPPINQYKGKKKNNTKQNKTKPGLIIAKIPLLSIILGLCYFWDCWDKISDQ